MVAARIAQEELSNKPPEGMLPYEKNCVAMALSRTLGIGVYATVNLVVRKGWASSPAALEHESTIERLIQGLGLTAKLVDQPWQTVRAQIGTWPDGRYFAINSETHGWKDPKGKGHAFAIIKQGAWGTASNNSEKTGVNYGSTIGKDHIVSVWGPV